MNMKECCKMVVTRLDGIITDSFYDDTNGDYVELYIDNPNNDDIMLQIIFDADGFGFVYRDYNDFYKFDENTEKNAEKLIGNILDIISGRLCLVTLYRDGNGWSADKLTEFNSLDNTVLNGFISEYSEAHDSGIVELVLWTKSGYDTLRFADCRIC